MGSRNLSLSFLALLVAVALAYWLLAAPPEGFTPPAVGGASLSAPLPKLPNSVSVNVVASQSPISSTEQLDNSKELLLRFNHSQSYRAFIFDAIRHPEWGGLQFAQTVLTHCKRYPLGSVPPDTLPAEQASATSTLVARCDLSREENKQLSDMLVGQEFDEIVGKTRSLALTRPLQSIDAHEFEELLKSDDPNRNLLVALHKSDVDRDAKAAAITSILRTENPFMILHTLPLESNSITGGYKVYFDGKWYPSEGNTNALFLAYDLASCNLGLDCGASSFKALSLCSSRGICGDSVASSLRNWSVAREGPRNTEIERLASALTAAIRQGNAKPFMPTDAPAIQ